MPLLVSRFHLIAPDLPLFGFTKVDGESYRYTFAQLTETTQAFVDALRLGRFAMYVFDYGAPIRFNLAVADPSRITGPFRGLESWVCPRDSEPCVTVTRWMQFGSPK